jgi:flagellar hook-basal body complex protein FliE
MIDKISPDMLMSQLNDLKSNQLDSLNNIDQLTDAKGPEESGFKDILGQLISEVDNSQKAADVSLEKLATGETNSIQDVVLKMQEADLSFQLMKEVRDKLMKAYQDIMSMQA